MPNLMKLTAAATTALGLLASVQTPALAGTVATGNGVTYLVIHEDGSIRAWGGNTSGQHGNGTTAKDYGRTTYAEKASSLTNVISVSAGGGNNNTGVSFALLRDGTVWAWGFDFWGNLGDGRTQINSQPTPIQVQGLSGVTAIASSPDMSSSYAVMPGGVVWAWGLNSTGNLGDGTTTYRTRPVQVLSINNITKVSSSGSHTLAVKTDGTVWAWGANAKAQLGDGSGAQRNVPVQVRNVYGAVDVCASISGWSAALLSDGTITAWGSWSGPVSLAKDSKTVPATGGVYPVAMPTLKNINKIACTGSSLLAIDNGGQVLAAGLNGGAFGNGRAKFAAYGFGVAKVSHAIDIDASGDSVIVATADGSVWTWGDNAAGGEPQQAMARANHYFNRIEATGEQALAMPFDVSVLGYSRDVTVTSTIQPADVGKIGSIYVVALLGSTTYFHNGTGWLEGSLDNLSFPIFYAGQLPASSRVVLPYWDASLSGAVVYVGYGYGTDTADMLRRSNYRIVYTYQ